MATVTLQQLEDALGSPIVLLEVYDRRDKTYHEFTLEQLPAAAINAVLQFIANHTP